MRRLARLLLVGIVGSQVILFGAFWLGFRGSDGGEPGRLSEATYRRPSETPPPILTDATAAWGLNSVALKGRSDVLAGGSAVGDWDGDGDLDLIIANGPLILLTWEDGAFAAPVDLGVDRSMAIGMADLDADGWLDLLVGRDADTDAIIWGGPAGATTSLVGGNPTSGFLAAELTGDNLMDLVRLGRGSADVLWAGAGNRTFTPSDLPGSDRLSLAGELADVDGDGLLDVWITRDVGWSHGPDSLYSRRPDGQWADRAESLGVALEIDGMGVTLADLNGDLALDAYVSDLGDNEVLMGVDGGFEPASDTGAARIRPPGAAQSVVSSSWGSGATDLNLDGVLDLVVVNGGFPGGGVDNKIPQTEVAVEESPAILIGIGGGRFVDVWPELGFPPFPAARGLTIADLDSDGDDDLLMVAVDGTVRALRNDTSGPSLTVTAAPGCPPEGAVVSVGSFQRLLAPHTFASGHGAAVIVGQSGPVSIRWGDGTSTRHEDPGGVGRRTLVAVCG